MDQEGKIVITEVLRHNAFELKLIIIITCQCPKIVNKKSPVSLAGSKWRAFLNLQQWSPH